MEKATLIEHTMSYYLQLVREHWAFYSLLSYQWWMLILLTLIPWFIWFKWMDKKRMIEILAFGLIIIFIMTITGPIGRNLDLWHYPQRIHWSLTTPFFPYETSLIPIGYMLIYQYGANWRIFFIGNLLLTGLYAFVGEPLLILLNMVRLYHWNHFFSFLLLLVISSISRWITINHLLEKGDMNHENNEHPLL